MSYNELRSTFENPQESLLLSLFNNGQMNYEQSESFKNLLPKFWPTKGFASVVVSDQDKALQCLNEHLADMKLPPLSEQTDYPELADGEFKGVGFIQRREKPYPRLYVGKFTLPNFHDFLIKLIDNDVSILNYHFEFPEDD